MFSCTYLVALYALRAESELSSVHLSTKGQGSDAQPLLALAGASSTVHCRKYCRNKLPKDLLTQQVLLRQRVKGSFNSCVHPFIAQKVSGNQFYSLKSTRLMVHAGCEPLTSRRQQGRWTGKPEFMLQEKKHSANTDNAANIDLHSL